MARKQVLVQLDDTQVAALDRLAAASNDNRSELIRSAIDLYVRALHEALADVRYAEAYAITPENPAAFAGLRAIASWPED